MITDLVLTQSHQNQRTREWETSYGLTRLTTPTLPLTSVIDSFKRSTNASHRSTPLRKIFNKNTLKLSHSCMPSIQNIISVQNKSLLIKENQNNPGTTQECNCYRKETCPFSGNCQSERIVYQAAVTREDNGEEKTYVGITEGTFKTRYLNHTSSCRNPKRKHATELSKYIWNWKESNVQHSIKWKIIKQCRPYKIIKSPLNIKLKNHIIIIQTLFKKKKQLRFGDRPLLQQLKQLKSRVLVYLIVLP